MNTDHPQPQRSEEEWTPERVKDYLKWSDGVVKLAMDFTAELTAERQRCNESEMNLLNAISYSQKQLLSALAAIEKHNHSDNLLHNNCCAIDVDLSLPHEHDKRITDNVWAACKDYVKEVRNVKQ